MRVRSPAWGCGASVSWVLLAPLRSITILAKGQLDQPESVFVSGIALNQYAKWRSLDKYDEETLVELRMDFARACGEGSWAPGRDKPGHVITFRDRNWVISADGNALVLCVPLRR